MAEELIFKNNKQKSEYNSNARKWVGITMMVISTILLVLSIFPKFLNIGNFFYRIFGFTAIILYIFNFLMGFALYKKLSFTASRKYAVYIFMSYLSLVCLLHLIFQSDNLSNNYVDFAHMGNYLKDVYSLNSGYTVGGASLSCLVFFIRAIVGVPASYVIYIVMSAIFIGLTIDYIIYNKSIEKRKNIYTKKTKAELEEKLNNSSSYRNNDDYSNVPNFSFNKSLYEETTEEPNEAFTSNLFDETETYSSSLTTNTNNFGFSSLDNFGDSSDDDSTDSLTSREIARKKLFEDFGSSSNNEEKDTEPEQQKSARELLFGGEPKLPDYFYTNKNAEQDTRNFVDSYRRQNNITNTNNTLYSDPTPTRTPNIDDNILNTSSVRSSWNNFSPEVDDNENQSISNRSEGFNFTNRNETRFGDTKNFEQNNESLTDNSINDDISFTSRRDSRRNTISDLNINKPIFEAPKQNPEPKKPEKKVTKQTNIYDDAPKKYFVPSTSLMTYYKDDNVDHTAEYKKKSEILEQLLDSFKIPAKVSNVVRGPKVTRYELSIPIGIPVTRVTALEKNIEMALETPSGIRIEAPIPGKNAVGIEVQNDKSSTVGLREIIESPEFTNAKQLLPIAIGKNISGNVVVHSMKKMVHALVAGSTGSGKSVFLHSLILSLLFKMGPDDLKFIIIDPKQVEFGRYNGLPHLILPKVVTDFEAAINALAWAVKEMDRRFKMLGEMRFSNIEMYNESDKVKSGEEKKMPYIVIIVDELADLMTFDKNNIEKSIQRITQLGRAAGIHMVVATQRPSVDVITGVIKNNLPTRIAFSLASGVDSKTIINEVGAEKLLGQGDMLFAPQDSNKKTRLQAAFISDREIDEIVKYIIANNIPSYDEEIAKEINKKKEEVPEDSGKGKNDDDDSKANSMDALMPKCLELVMQRGKATITMLQTRLSIGYSRAARIIAQMEERGFISDNNDGKPREVYITQSQFDELFGENNGNDGE